MKKLSYLFSALAVTAMVGCSSDDVVQQQTAQALQTTRAITFSPMTKGATTRSQVYQSTADMTSFNVIALLEQSISASAQNPVNIYIGGKEEAITSAISEYSPYSAFTSEGNTKGVQEVIYSASGWNFRDGKTRYWPYTATKEGDNITGYTCIPLLFRAYSPTSFSSAYDDAKSFLHTGSASFPNTEEGYFHFNMTKDGDGNWLSNPTPVPVAEMRDICFAQTSATSAGGAVALEFKHAFTQIVFKAKKTSNYQVDIKKIEIGGMKYSGTMIFNNYSDDQNWRGDFGSNTTVYPGFASTTPISLTSAADEAPVQLTEKGQELLLIPQTITKWNPSEGAAINSENNNQPRGGFIAVTFRYRLSTSTEWITGGASSTDGYETTYFPLEANWGKGKKYNYTLLFGGAEDNGDGDEPGSGNPDPTEGYDEDGKPKAPSVAITFNPTVSAWEEYKVDIND